MCSFRNESLNCSLNYVTTIGLANGFFITLTYWRIIILTLNYEYFFNPVSKIIDKIYIIIQAKNQIRQTIKKNNLNKFVNARV